MAALTDFRTKYPQYDNISDKDLADALHRKYYSDLDVNDYYQKIGLDQGINYLELTGEMGKGVARGFGSGLLSAGAGLAELADVGTDLIGLEDLIDSGNENELIRLANEGKQALNESLGVGDLYKDNYLVKLSEGLGSIGSFFVPGLGAARGASLLGAGARAAGIAGTSATVGAGVGAGASEQADRVAAARARGEDVSAGQEDLAIALGGLIGSSEALAPLSILKKIRRFRDPVKSEEAFSAVKSMMRAGAFEGAQEVVASLAQSAVEDAVYSDEVTYGDTLWDDFTVGAGAGALLDAITTGVYRRRANAMRESEVEKEAALRASEAEAAESFYEDAERAKVVAEKTDQAQRKAELDAVLEGDEAAFDAEQAAVAREEVRYDPVQQFVGGVIDPARMTPSQLAEATYNYSNQLANNAVKSAEGFPDVGKFDVAEEMTPEGPVFKAVHSETGQQFGQPFQEREGAIHLMANLNQQIFNRRINSAVIDSLDLSPEAYTPKQAESLYVIGQKLNRPQTFSINAAVLNEAAGTIQSPSSPYREDKSIDQLHTLQYGVPPYTDRGEKLYRPLSNLTAAQQINFERRKKGLREAEEFSLDEAKQVLGDRYTKVFDVLLGVKAPGQDQILEDFGTVGARLAKSRQEYQDERRTLAEAKRSLVSKNIMSDVSSPEVKYIFEKIVGESDVGKMTPSQRMYLVNEIKKFPVVQGAVSIPDFRPRPYTRTQYNAAVRHVSETGDGTVENIESILGDIGSTKRIRTVASALRKDIQKAGLINNRDEVSVRPALPAPAEPFVPEIKPYEEKVSEEAKNLEDALSNDLKGMGLDDIRVRVLDTLKRGPVTREGEVILTGRPEEDISDNVEGFFKPASRTVFLGLDRINETARDQTPEARRQALADILDHELVHGVRNLDLWTGQEWSLLENLAKKKIVPGSGNVTFYNDAQSRYEDLNAVSQMEEAVADLIRYGRKDKKLITGKPRSLVERMYEFFERTGNALRGSGFQSFEDVLTRLERGEIGARQRGEIRTLRALERGRGAVPERGIGLERDVLTDKQVFTGAGVTLPETEEEQIQASRGVEEREVGAPDTRVRPEVANAYRRFQDGEISREDYDAVVLGTISEYDFVPRPATTQEMSDALDKPKKKKINLPIDDGAPVGLRLDIHAYTRHGVWVPTIHAKGMTSHRATASVSNADFTRIAQPTAQRILEGTVPGTRGYIERERIRQELPEKEEALKRTKKYKEADKDTQRRMRENLRNPLRKFDKNPFARIEGNFVNRTDAENQAIAREALDSPDWIQVGFDPRRHSYFYDRKTGEPVTFAEEVVQIGPLVLAKNATKNVRPSGDPFETLYSRRPRRSKAGQYVGAPKELDSPQKLGALRRAIRGLALEGAPGRFWYEQSGKALLNITGGDRDEAKKLAQAIAITSPQTPVPSNFNYALQAYYQHKAGQPIRTGMFPVRMSRDLEAVFAGKDWEGRKTNNFYNNVMREIDATIAQGVTTDIWMMRAFGFMGDVPTDAQYSFVENEVKRLAEGLGWEPQQVQAAVWVAMKARTENKDVKKRTEKISQRKGYMRYDEDAKTGKKTRVLLDPERHRQVWLNEAMKYDPTGAEKDQAKFDYSDAARNNLSQISWESIPGVTSGHLPEIFDAQYPEIQEYHVEISKAFLDEDGNDLVARELGILSPGDFEAPGFFEDRVSPGTQTQVVSPKRYKLGPKEFETEPAAEDLIKAYAAVRGILMKQDGVGYHRPFADKKTIRKGDLNGIEIDIGRPFTESETAEFARLMKEYSGHGEYNPIGSERGARLINFDYLIDEPSKEEISRQDGDQEKAAFKVRSEANNNFNNMVVKAVTAIDFENVDSAEVGRFAADAGYIGNDWSVDRNGESYIQSIGEISPDLQRRVEDLIHRLQPRIDAVDQNFSEKYGWTQNERINKNFKPRQDEVVYDALPDKGPQDIEREGIVESRRRTASEVANAFAQTSPPNTILGAAKRTPEVQNSIIEQEVFGEPMAFQTKGYTFGDKFIYQIADKFVGLKNVEAQINNYRRGLGLSPLKATESPYVGEESIAGIVGNKMRQFEEDRKRPLANKIANSGYSLEEVDEFLIMRHAIERNERIAIRDPERDVENNPGSGKLKTGQVLSNSFVKRKMKERYGLDWDSANELWVGGNSRAKKLGDIAADLDQIVNETLDTTVEGGLLDKDTAETIRGAYKYYAPMRGKDIEDDYAENVIVGSSLSTRGKEFLRAMGRESAAQSPLGHILLNAERAMTRAAKNKQFGERLVNLIRANPDEDFWRVISPEDPRYARVFEKKFTYVGPDKNLRGETFSEVPRDANKRDFVQRITLKRDNLTPGFDQDLIGVKLNGQQVYVELTDKRLRDAVVSMDAGTADNLIQKFSIVNRFLSMMNTSLNPEFVIGNFSRDVQTAIFNILGEQDMSQGKAKDQRLVTQVLKDVIPSMGVFYKGLRRGELKDGTFIGDLSGLDPKDQADFKEFMESGAKADWFHSRPPEEQVETVQSMVDMANGTFKGTFKRRFQQVMQFVEDSNSAVENAVRLATFKASRDELLNAGIPRQEAVSQAASLAKNLTVNFNRKGMAGDLLNSIYLFFNASVQGTANFARGLFGPNMNPLSPEASRVKQGAVSSLIMFGALAAARAEEESEENPDSGRSYYSEIPDFVKERNIVIMADDGKNYYTIPLPYGYNVFHVLGQNLMEMKSGNISPTKAASNVTSAFLGSFSPIGFSSPAPTITQPFVELARNENFFGSPIYRENFPTGTQQPDSQLAMSTTRTPFKVIAKSLNAMIGGNEQEPGAIDISPDTLEHLAEFALGGAGTFGLRNYDAFEKWQKGEELKVREIPFLRRIKGEPDERVGAADFYERKIKLEQKEARLDALRGRERLRYRRENSGYFKTLSDLDRAERRLRDLRKRRDRLKVLASRSPDAAVRFAEAEQRIYDLMNLTYNRFNKSYDRKVGRTK